MSILDTAGAATLSPREAGEFFRHFENLFTSILDASCACRTAMTGRFCRTCADLMDRLGLLIAKAGTRPAAALADQDALIEDAAALLDTARAERVRTSWQAVSASISGRLPESLPDARPVTDPSATSPRREWVAGWATGDTGSLRPKAA